MKKKIGLLLTFFRPEWTGGFLYLINIINASNNLAEKDKPHFVVFYNERSEKWLNLIDYPYIDKVYLKNYKNNLTTTLLSIITFKNLFVRNVIEEYHLNGLFPVNDYLGRVHNPRGISLVAWFPDMQHKFYPQYFGFINRIFREIRFRIVLFRATDLVSSSYDVLSHIKKFYKTPPQLRTHVLRFVSQIDKFENDIIFLRNTYNIDKPYFIISNQFFKHKNHIVVFKAINLLKILSSNFQVVFTGKEDDYRNPDYIKGIKQFITDNNLSPLICLLGLIPRAHQLGLMKNALAVIQPSKFEGWSTVVEDAKSLEKQVVLSDIPVHREQMDENAFYFDSGKDEELSKIMNDFLNDVVIPKVTYNNYNERVKLFANDFLTIFNSR